MKNVSGCGWRMYPAADGECIWLWMENISGCGWRMYPAADVAVSQGSLVKQLHSTVILLDSS